MLKPFCCYLCCVVLILCSCQQNSDLLREDFIGTWEVEYAAPAELVTSSTSVLLHANQHFEAIDLHPAFFLRTHKGEEAIASQIKGSWSLVREGYGRFINLSPESPPHLRSVMAKPNQTNGLTLSLNSTLGEVRLRKQQDS